MTEIITSVSFLTWVGSDLSDLKAQELQLVLVSEKHELKMNGVGGLVVKALAHPAHETPGFESPLDPLSLN